jgi:hypothetical protein
MNPIETDMTEWLQTKNESLSCVHLSYPERSRGYVTYASQAETRQFLQRAKQSALQDRHACSIRILKGLSHEIDFKNFDKNYRTWPI